LALAVLLQVSCPVVLVVLAHGIPLWVVALLLAWVAHRVISQARPDR
jgi:hypothetical protein